MHIISGIQQIGIGVSDVHAGFKWYRQSLGFDVPIFDAPGTAELMLRYTGGQPQERHAILAVNMQGGGGFEIWQYLSRTPEAASFDVTLGDLGIAMCKVKSKDVLAAYRKLKDRGEKLSPMSADPWGNPCFYVEDPFGNFFQVVQSDNVFMKTPDVNGGVYGAVFGVSDMDKSIAFYKDILGYDRILYDETGTFDDYQQLPGGEGRFRRVLMAHSEPRKGPFGRMLGETQIELVCTLERTPSKIFENRYWGDLGFIHMCFDVQGMQELRKHCDALGYPFTVDSNPDEGTFEMGEAAGRFAYIEDPDGALIEFVETHKLPIHKKWGWYKDLRKRDPGKPLPDWMIKTLGFNRVKD